MIRRTRIRRHWRHAQIAARVKGTTVVLRWREWPDGRPAADPTTGAVLATEELQPLLLSLTLKTLVHFVQPTTTGIRQHVEVQVGDVIVDFNVPLVRVLDAGDTALEANQVLSEFDLKVANANSPGQSASYETLEIEGLEQLTFEIDGRRYVQKPVGDQLARSWEAVISDIQFSRALLLKLDT
jgi:hypothetical protein